MSLLNPLPPQAYTKEILLKAYQWLQEQSEHVRELASTPDILVSLYLKAKQEGEEVLHRPSIKNFKMELKNLAGLMGDFDNNVRPSHIVNFPPKPLLSQKMTSASTSHTASSSTPALSSETAFSEISIASTSSTETSSNEISSTAIPSTAINANSTPPISANLSSFPSSISIDLDSRSLQMIKEVKTGLNLSHDTEAIRALISMGFKKYKSMIL